MINSIFIIIDINAIYLNNNFIINVSTKKAAD